MPLPKLLAACLAAASWPSRGAEPACAEDQTCEAEAEARGAQALLQSKGEVGLLKMRKETVKSRQLEESGLSADVVDSLMRFQGKRSYAARQSDEKWLPMANGYVGYSTSARGAAKCLDGKKKTNGGAVHFVVDMGKVYEVSKTYIDWRVCKCDKAGSVILIYSEDGKSWSKYQEPTVYAWGDHKKRYYSFEPIMGRFFAVIPTEEAGLKWVDMWEYELYGKPLERIPNVYGWYQSYRNGEMGLDGTEILHLWPYKGKLFAGTGYWKNMGKVRSAEVVRLDCAFCDWVVEASLGRYAGRAEVLKSIRWTTDASGAPLNGGPVDKLMAAYYMNYEGEGHCYFNVRNDESVSWFSEPYWKNRPFKANHFSARAMTLFKDPVTGVDRLFFSTGMDGIVSGTYDASRWTTASFQSRTESGPVETRPLALAIMDNNLYFTASSYIKRRVNGDSPSWVKVFDMADVDRENTVDEAVGGIRGIGSIANPASRTGHSLLFAWSPNERSAGCMIRLDPRGDSFVHEQEMCTRDVARSYLGKNKDHLAALVTFVITDYNFPLQVMDGATPVQLMGFEMLLFSYSTYQFPIDVKQAAKLKSGKKIAFSAGGGYMIRRNASDYEARTPGGPRHDPMAIYPRQVAVRCYAESPFGDNATYFGGYDCNHYDSKGTAWAQRATHAGAFAEPVPCQPELGCGHTPGEAFRAHGCDWCRGGRFDRTAIAGFQGAGPLTCQAVLDWLNGEGAEHCEAGAKDWKIAEYCCQPDCDFCEGTGKAYKGDSVAGVDGDGKDYTCDTAVHFVRQGGAVCGRAQEWWSGACCA